MYNRYIPQDTGWTRVSEADFPPGPAAPRGPGSEPESREGLSGLLQGLLKPQLRLHHQKQIADGNHKKEKEGKGQRSLQRQACRRPSSEKGGDFPCPFRPFFI